MAYLYRHIRLDKNEVFYIGVGGLDKFDNYKRAYSKQGRNKIWKGIVSRTDFEVEIILDDLKRETVLIKEIEFVNLYGRLDLNTGTLCNLTEGGIGGRSRVVPEHVKEYLRNKYTGIPRPEHVKIAMNRQGYSHTQEAKDKISLATKGSNNAFFGKKHTTEILELLSKIVINIETGIFYMSAKEASEVTHYKYNHFKAMLNGNAKNKTSFIYAI